jgi:uncharacterized membrane protein YraQ (UPF0718 family)/copper chaperone CopZ
MLTVAGRFFLEVLFLLGQMAPYLTLGFIFAGLLHAFVPKRAVVRHLGGESVGSAVKAAVIGVPMPLCSCGVVPTGIGLRKRGASRAAVVSFLVSTPQTGVDSIAATYGFFGWVLAVFRPIAAFVSGIAAGVATLLLKRNAADDEHWMKYHIQSEDALESTGNHPSLIRRFAGGLRFAFIELLGDISLWLVLGLALAAVISLIVPDDFFADRLPGGLVQKLVMMIFGIPLYVCSTASIPIAAVLMTKGISAGAAFVFLMTGPASNAATMLIIGRVMGRRVLAVYLASIALLALGFGVGLDFLTTQFDLTIESAAAHEPMLPGWITWGAAGLLSFFITLHFLEWLDRRFLRRGTMGGERQGMELAVEGMTCSHCVRMVTDALRSVPGVTEARVTLATGRAHVEGEKLDRDDLKKAVEDVGYRIKG